MATNKNQHFVPRCYLRPFTLNSENKAINLFNIDRLRLIERAPVKNQCSGDYFYGDNQSLEDAIQFVERSYASTLREVLSSGYKLTNYHRTVLRRFWLLQHMRTEAASRRAVEVAEETRVVAGVPESEFSPSIKEAVIDAMKMYAELMDIMDDLKVCLFRNKTSVPFVTSDDPAVLSNRWYLKDSRTQHRSFGFRSSGVVFFLPLSPEVLCVGYDGDVYNIPHVDGWVNISSESDVKAVNQHQFLNCMANIYVCDVNHAEFVHESYREISGARPGVRHRLHFSVKDYENGEYTRYKVVDPYQQDEYEEALIHMQTVHAQPTHWPRQIKWRRPGAVYTNGSGVGFIRKAAVETVEAKEFWKEKA